MRWVEFGSCFPVGRDIQVHKFQALFNSPIGLCRSLVMQKNVDCAIHSTVKLFGNVLSCSVLELFLIRVKLNLRKDYITRHTCMIRTYVYYTLSSMPSDSLASLTMADQDRKRDCRLYLRSSSSIGYAKIKSDISCTDKYSIYTTSTDILVY